MVEIREIGRVVPTDKNGELTENVSSFDLIESTWKEAVEELTHAYQEHFGPRLHSLYLRGSVARGEAVEGISDLDTLGILKDENDEMDRLWQKKSKSFFESRYPFAKIDCSLMPLEELLTSPRKTGVRILLKTQGVLLAGQDILTEIPAYKPDVATLAQLSANLKEEVDTAPKRLPLLNESERESYIRFLMKQILRGAFLLVMPREKVFTRDLSQCYSLFSKYYPEQEPSAKKPFCGHWSRPQDTKRWLNS